MALILETLFESPATEFTYDRRGELNKPHDPRATKHPPRKTRKKRIRVRGPSRQQNKRNTGSRTDAGSPSRTQGSVTVASGRHGCCVSLLLHSKGTHPNYRTFVVTIMSFVCLVFLLRICRDHNPWAISSRGETTAAESVRTQSLGWKLLHGLYLLRSAGLSLSCCCATPSTTTSTSDQHLYMVGYSRNFTAVRTHTAEEVLEREPRTENSTAARRRWLG